MKLEKLTITVYKDKYGKRQDESGQETDIYRENKKIEVMFNPESYSLKHRIKHSGLQGIQTTGRESQFSCVEPEELSLKLIFDDTGVSDFGFVKMFSRKPTVYERVRQFLKMCVAMDGKKHKPNGLVVQWGELVFECDLTSVDVTYSMFDRGGSPVRAELDTVFTGSVKDLKRVLLENKSSPDLTHLRTVKSGDTLPLMSEEIYGDCSRYLEIARVNGLDSPRRLKEGSVLKFPPLEDGASR